MPPEAVPPPLWPAVELLPLEPPNTPEPAAPPVAVPALACPPPAVAPALLPPLPAAPVAIGFGPAASSDEQPRTNAVVTNSKLMEETRIESSWVRYWLAIRNSAA
jgi:hypothetical protein